MKKHFLLLAGVSVLMGLTTACMDDKYDLSDIDTTAQFKVEDLTIPVNIDAVKLSTIIDLNDDDPDAVIKEVNGSYAIVKGGDFHSSEITVNQINVQGVSGQGVTTRIETGLGGAGIPAVDVTLPFSTAPVSFQFTSNDVPSEIQGIDNVAGAFTLSLIIELPELKSVMKKLYFNDLVITLPKGINGTPNMGTLDAAKGEITIPSAEVLDGKFVLTISCTSIDFPLTEATFVPAATDNSKGSLALNGDMSIKQGSLVLKSADIQSNLPASISLNSSLSVSNITVNGFSGKIKYAITGVNIDPVELYDLPDFLSQEGTRLSLANPQIYLSINNPIAPWDLNTLTGMSITSEWPADRNTPSKTATLDDGEITLFPEAVKNYVLAPVDPGTYYAGFANPKYYAYSGLKTLLDGNGIPNRLIIKLDNPHIYTQTVKDFRLGTPIGKVDGKYQFYAPLALGAGSQVVYTDTETGWNDEDVDAINISKLKVTANVSSTVPFGLKLTAYPIDVNGNKINNVNIEGIDVPANAHNHAMTIQITGDIRHLDGIVYTATGTVPSDMATPLGPDQQIILENIRATVSGTYTKEL